MSVGKTSSFYYGGGCVEVTFSTCGATVSDTKWGKYGPAHFFDWHSWNVFIEDAVRGEYDFTQLTYGESMQSHPHGPIVERRGDERIEMRHPETRDILWFDQCEWDAFIEGVKAGEFSRSALEEHAAVQYHA